MRAEMYTQFGVLHRLLVHFGYTKYKSHRTLCKISAWIWNSNLLLDEILYNTRIFIDFLSIIFFINLEKSVYFEAIMNLRIRIKFNLHFCSCYLLVEKAFYILDRYLSVVNTVEHMIESVPKTFARMHNKIEKFVYWVAPSILLWCWCCRDICQSYQ